MSISSITSLAVARNLRQPDKADAGVAPAGTDAAGENPSLPEILAKTVPVGLVSAYTAFIAVVTQVVLPTKADPSPDPQLWLRWLALAILVLTAAFLTYGSYRSKAGEGARFPLVEVSAVTVAAAAWGIGIPESPLLATLDNKTQGLLVLALIAFAGVAINLVLSNLMKQAD